MKKIGLALFTLMLLSLIGCACMAETDVKVGSVIQFGRYPQSTSGEYSPINWKVLEVTDSGRIIAISEKILRYYSGDTVNSFFWGGV